jgi:twitching motility two-component system response regulator PilG
MTDSVSRSALEQGIAAAKSGGRLVARLHLRTAIEASGRDPIAWAWMAWLAETPEEAVASMQRAVAIDPDDDVAWAGLRFVLSLASSPRYGAVTSSSARADDRIAIEVIEAALPTKPLVNSTFVPSAPASVEADPSAPGFALEAAPLLPEVPTGLEIDLEPARPQDAVLEEALDSSADHEVVATSSEDESRPEIVGEFDIAALSVASPSTHDEPEAVVEPSQQIEHEATVAIEGSTPAFEPGTPLTVATLPLGASSTALESSSPHTLASLPVEASTPVSAPASPRTVAAPPVFEPALPRSLPRKPKVLVVDDSPTVCKLVMITLSNRGYHVMSSPDGAEAISELAQSKPDLILMDITMPKLDGYKLCKLVTSHPSTKHIPVVMLSGKDGFFDKTRGKFAGCVDYITKPFDPENLLRVVNEYLPQPESARGTSAAGQMRIRAGGG